MMCSRWHMIFKAKRRWLTGEFVIDRENDVLMAVLGNKKHGGRTRAVGSTTPWSIGFKDKSKVRERRPRLEKKDRDALRAEIQAEVEKKLDEKLESTLTQKLAIIRDKWFAEMCANANMSVQLLLPSSGCCRSSDQSQTSPSVTIQRDPLDSLDRDVG